MCPGPSLCVSPHHYTTAGAPRGSGAPQAGAAGALRCCWELRGHQGPPGAQGDTIVIKQELAVSWIINPGKTAALASELKPKVCGRTLHD